MKQETDLTVALIPGLLGFVFSLWALWNVQLLKAFPLVFAVSVVTAAIASLIFLPLSPLVALLSAISVMVWCRHHSAWALPRNPRRPAQEGAT